MPKIEIDKYEGEISLVAQLDNLISKKYASYFEAVLVHGSLATGEEIAYSDFDGLLIVKDNFLDSKALVQFQQDSMELIHQFDPLQHHGWFIISKDSLNDYPQNYLPIEVLEHAKVIWPAERIELNYNQVSKLDSKEGFSRLVKSLLKKIESNYQPKSLFELKSLLSEVMLLPAVYYQASRGKCIFKKFSFEAIRADFDESVYSIMDTTSAIRLKWYVPSFRFKGLFLWAKNKKYLKKNARRYLAPAISVEIRKELNKDYYNRLTALIQEMQKKVYG